jgi:CheY-specific phosphatase CheX
MQSKYDIVLSEVFCDVLLKYGFMFGEPLPKDEISINDPVYLHTSVAFNGYRSGIQGISASADLTTQLASNVLGIDQSDVNSLEDSQDALKELNNIVCGQFLTSAFGENPLFDLSPPSVKQIDSKEWKKLIDNENTIALMVEDIPVIMYVSVKQEVNNDPGSDYR